MVQTNSSTINIELSQCYYTTISTMSSLNDLIPSIIETNYHKNKTSWFLCKTESSPTSLLGTEKATKEEVSIAKKLMAQGDGVSSFSIHGKASNRIIRRGHCSSPTCNCQCIVYRPTDNFLCLYVSQKDHNSNHFQSKPILTPEEKTFISSNLSYMPNIIASRMMNIGMIDS